MNLEVHLVEIKIISRGCGIWLFIQWKPNSEILALCKLASVS